MQNSKSKIQNQRKSELSAQKIGLADRQDRKTVPEKGQKLKLRHGTDVLLYVLIFEISILTIQTDIPNI